MGDNFYGDMLDFGESVLVGASARAVAICPVAGDYSYIFAPTKQRARQEGVKLSRENDASSFVAAIEAGQIHVYVASLTSLEGGWRANKGGLERSVVSRDLPFVAVPLGATVRGRLSPLAVG